MSSSYAPLPNEMELLQMANELADEGLAHFDICLQALKKNKGSLKKTKASL